MIDSKERNGIHILVQRHPFDFGLSAIIVNYGREGVQQHLPSVAEPLVFKKVKEGDIYPSQHISLAFDAPQRLMDELWNCGVRPSDAKWPKGEINAMTTHLKDMRTIAFNCLKIK